MPNNELAAAKKTYKGDKLFAKKDFVKLPLKALVLSPLLTTFIPAIAAEAGWLITNTYRSPKLF